MKSLDRRLVEKMDGDEQEKHFKYMVESLPDVTDKGEECKIIHKPINLLKKLTPVYEINQEKTSNLTAQKTEEKSSR